MSARRRHRVRGLLLTDYAGHPFTAELAHSLRSGLSEPVTYSYCSTVSTPKGDLRRPGSVGVPAGNRFEKYDLKRRLVSELRYGINTARLVVRERPLTHVVCNMPLVSLAVVWAVGAATRVRLIVWLQDGQAGIVGGLIGRGRLAAGLEFLEGFLLRRASRVIAISEDLAAEAKRQRVRPDRVRVMENWAPIAQLPTRPHDNTWARANGFVERRPVFLYAGTLGRKHRPENLLALADGVREVGGRVVVVSEGEGADVLRERGSSGQYTNLDVLPYQSFSDLPDVLGTADVLVTLLEPLAGRFSVPSKVLSYLCAGRPILASLPLDNPAAEMITERARAGLAAAPTDEVGFVEAAVSLASSEEARATMGKAARAFAERHFAESVVVERFLAALAGDVAPAESACSVWAP